MNALFKNDELELLKSKLLFEHQRLTALLSKTRIHLHRSEPISADFAEQATETENDQVVDFLDQEAQIELSQVNKALLRIKQGGYGDCVVCGQKIKTKRLHALPHTPFCIDCASEK
ncbi:TraR/DksA family transcriptional regulator [Marinicella litoralis]|uniref:TraR/DksA family transcriptional regulator n=1 Tax=Marinicella litoralis TaxID=644220 RepID=A0A4R6XYP5_9GAMM|nr:TraR/DksA family transcriptional regulator [Marinicella litoralis]TDR23650.1 TraR/DksA family transcriptional regulator [Marinicella litoralis]